MSNQVAYYQDTLWNVLLLTGGIACLSELNDPNKDLKHRLNVWEHNIKLFSITGDDQCKTK